MQSSTNPEKDPRYSEKDDSGKSEPTKSDQQRSDPPLTEIKGVTDPEEYVEPKVEKEPKKED